MRVLLLNDCSTPTGGAELQHLRLRELLRGRGHEVRLLSSSAHVPGDVPRADVLCRGTFHPKLRVLGETANPSAALVLRKELVRFRPDVVHARMLLTQLSPLVLPVLADVPTLWQVVTHKVICPKGTKLLPDGRPCPHPPGRVCRTEGCLTPQSWAAAMVQQRLRRHWSHHVDAVTTLSGSMRRRLEAEGVPVASVIPNGVRDRPARPALTGPPLVAFAGRLVAEKGVAELLHAMAEVHRRLPSARLLVAGDGPEAPALRQLAGRLLPADVVRFTGRLDRADLEAELDRAWVQAVPGLWEEPLGNVSLEAAVRGTAAVVTAIGGPAEVVQDGRTGLLVPPGDPGALASALVRLLGDRDRAEELGLAAREHALQHYTEERMVDRLLDTYEGLRARHGQEPAA